MKGLDLPIQPLALIPSSTPTFQVQVVILLELAEV
jgi:hypothetical protein